jgi:hypothetical protein
MYVYVLPASSTSACNRHTSSYHPHTSCSKVEVYRLSYQDIVLLYVLLVVIVVIVVWAAVHYHRRQKYHHTSYRDSA